jgi:hypothetical protein
MKLQVSHKKILTITTIMLLTTIILTISPQQTNAQNTATLQRGINYLSYGNAWTEPLSVLQNDFAQFKRDNVQFLSIRVMWNVMMPSAGNLSAYAVENIKKVLNTADAYGLKVNLAFWTQFGSTLGFPAWAGINYYNLTDEPTKTYYLNYLNQTVNQLKTCPAIDSYSILNEPYYTNASQKIPFQTLMADCAQTIKTADATHLVTCRFALSSTPATGRYDQQIYSLFDAFTITVYLNASNPNDRIYNSKWSDYEKTVQECKALGLPLWVIEFGTKSTDEQAAAVMYDANLAKLEADGVARACAWAWQTRNASNEAFNLYNGAAPKLAYYALTQTVPPSSTSSPIGTTNPTTQIVSTPKPAPTPTPTPKPQPQKTSFYNWTTTHHITAYHQTKPAAKTYSAAIDAQTLNLTLLGIATICAVIQFSIKKRIILKKDCYQKRSINKIGSSSSLC